MHEAEQYLRNPDNPHYLYVRYKNKRRRLFINDKQGDIGIIAIGKRKKGHVFSDWGGIDKIFDKVADKSKPVESPEEINYKMVNKYQREAKKAGFTNPFIRHIAEAVPTKSLFENNITTGNRIDGQIISLQAVREWCGEGTYRCFCEAVKNHTPYHSGRFNFRGYDGSLWVEVYDKDDGYHQAGDLNAGFSKEYRDCLNGYYYLLVNERTFIGYDVD
ncbi:MULTISPECIES: hypothetical protein [Bacteroidales]|jgi:hypothetical protein|uniref:hypothetical protein n=1 Tax=Bacteroidales TaxID=171549 RepID=UPI0011C8078F|nr:hypothetical protein [Bacteroides sp.]HJI18521.1 hypothetical protein [Rikenellaceae bacterium]